MPTTRIQKNDRTQLRLSALGVLSESVPIWACIQSASPTTQRVSGILLGLRAGDLVTGVMLHCPVAAAGTSPTTARFGIADSTGKILAISGNVNAAANWALGANAFPFAAAYTVPSDGGYYASFVVDGTWGSTQPTISRQTSAVAGPKAFGSNPIPGFQWAAQTDLPAVNSSMTITATNADFFYMAFY